MQYYITPPKNTTECFAEYAALTNGHISVTGKLLKKELINLCSPYKVFFQSNGFGPINQEIIDKYNCDYLDVRDYRGKLWGPLLGESYIPEASLPIDDTLDWIGVIIMPETEFQHPSQIPTNHYQHILRWTSLPVLVTATGWPTTGEIQQAAYIKRLPELFDGFRLVNWVGSLGEAGRLMFKEIQ